MSSIDDERRDRYWRAVEDQDKLIDERLAGIRRKEDAGELTPREAADERITAMEAHLEAVQELRRTYLGGQ